MGSSTLDAGDAVAIGAIVGGFIGAVIGGIYFGPVGALIGAVVGALVGALAGFLVAGAMFLADAADREIMFETAEWDAVDLRGIRCWPRGNAPPGFLTEGTTTGGSSICWPSGFPP